MIVLESFVGGAWRKCASDGRAFVDPSRGETIGRIDSSGLDMKAALAHARASGAALRELSFTDRGALLARIADILLANREAYGEIARRNSGNTVRDAAIDIDGGIGTLKYYARLGKTLGSARILVENGSDQLTKSEQFRARHIWTSRPGVAVCINAFNFPSWGLWEKVAVAFLAGVPVLAKPASATAWLAERMVRDVAAAGVLPDGVLSIVCGSADGLLDALEPFDGVLFTGSANTGETIRANANVLKRAPRVSIEADSVNAAILGESVASGSEIFDLLVREAGGALSTKAGQLCTNIRRIFAPAARMKDFVDALAAEADRIVVGDPGHADVRMGPLVNEAQRRAALEGLAALAGETSVVRGGGIPASVTGADAARGAFLAPTILMARDAAMLDAVHGVEIFGPAITVIPYRDRTEAFALAARGGGSLVASVWSDDGGEAAALATGLAPHHGRVLCVDRDVGSGHSGHAIVMPQAVHGGPGRAGGGEELGGLRGLRFHMQRSAIQGSPSMFAVIEADGAVASL